MCEEFLLPKKKVFAFAEDLGRGCLSSLASLLFPLCFSWSAASRRRAVLLSGISPYTRGGGWRVAHLDGVTRTPVHTSTEGCLWLSNVAK